MMCDHQRLFGQVVVVFTMGSVVVRGVAVKISLSMLFSRIEESEAQRAQLLQLQTRSSSSAHKTVLSPPRVSEAEM